MKKLQYTVVLLRPSWMSEWTQTPYGQDIYVAIGIFATNPEEAVLKAQQEAFGADRREGYRAANPIDYKVCVVFEGYREPVFFGWQMPKKRRSHTQS